MLERRLRLWTEQVRDGALPRRTFIARLGALGVSAPMAGFLLMDAGVAQAQPAFVYKPTKRGGGGTLKMLEWQAPTLLNPHFATGLKDNTGSRIFYEPLAQWDDDGNLVPVLAAEIPSRENGGVAPDAGSVVWRLKPGVTWHDGAPFDADDVVFNWRFATDPGTAATTAGNFRRLRIEKIDALSVRVVFERPSPFWPGLYANTMLVPRHLFAPYMGARSREAPTNLRPVGTGPYRFVEFRPADLLKAELYAGYHRPNRPHFDRLEMKAGGDAPSAARTVLQTGEYDYAGSLVFDDEVLRRMEAGGKGRAVMTDSSATSAIYLNFTDPATEVDGERSNPRTRHPAFSDPAVRRAFGLLIDRSAIQATMYGRQGVVTTNWINQPPRYRSPNTRAEFDIDKARRTLDAAGWKPGPDGVRQKDGRRLSFLFQGASGGLTQKVQAAIKSVAEKAGVRLELKSVPSSVFFSSDTGNPDTAARFLADIQTFNWTADVPDPQQLLAVFTSWECASKANQWQGQNSVRWQNAEYDAAYRAAEVELDPAKRAALFIRMNDLVVGDGYVVPFVARKTTRVVATKLRAPFSAWSGDMAFLADWYREA